MTEKFIVAVVGVCASGKTTLVKHLRTHGIEAYNVAQEHSGIKRLWQRRYPDMLILLDVNLPQAQVRRAVSWGEERLILQRERLRDAKTNADLFIQTDDFTVDEVTKKVLKYIRRRHGDVSNYCSRLEARP